jgi:uncharacterized protein (DUF488 family)
VFLGEELGARRSERECYVNDRADYDLIARTPAFNSGVDRVVRGAAKMCIALMCSEKDPLDCHRCILVSPRLRERGIPVLHILSDGRIENHEQLETRLLNLFELSDREFFRSRDEIVAEAYKLQGDKIAYREEETVLREKPPRYGN